MAWITGSRSAKTFRRLYGKVKHLKNCTFYTDSWDALSKVLPKVKHIIGKQHTTAIERDNSNIRNDLARFTRRTKVVSKSENQCKNRQEKDQINHEVIRNEMSKMQRRRKNKKWI